MARRDLPSNADTSASYELPGIALISRDGAAQLLMAPGESSDVERFPIRRAGKKTALRFAVGEPGRRGTIWRLWASRETDDVYLGSRHTAREAKMSLHQSGDWRFQIVDPERPKTVRLHDFEGTPDGRIIHRWARPKPNAVGWTHAVSIVLPAHHLVTIPDDGVRWDDVRWCPAPRPGAQVEFQVKIVSPDRGVVSYRELIESGGRLAVMDALQLASGDVAIVLALTVVTTEDEAAEIARYEEKARLGVPPATDFDRSPQLGPRHLVFGHDPDGRPRYYDLAFTVDPG
ncbi:MAG: hypothetical protein GEU93_04135 [Propionibacteriales bacterium]|nr:hypothetical protein [Propionibacteriales bacterium]